MKENAVNCAVGHLLWREKQQSGSTAAPPDFSAAASAVVHLWAEIFQIDAFCKQSIPPCKQRMNLQLSAQAQAFMEFCLGEVVMCSSCRLQTTRVSLLCRGAAGLHRQVMYGGLRIGLYEPVRHRNSLITQQQQSAVQQRLQQQQQRRRERQWRQQQQQPQPFPAVACNGAGSAAPVSPEALCEGSKLSRHASATPPAAATETEKEQPCALAIEQRY